MPFMSKDSVSYTDWSMKRTVMAVWELKVVGRAFLTVQGPKKG